MIEGISNVTVLSNYQNEFLSLDTPRTSRAHIQSFGLYYKIKMFLTLKFDYPLPEGRCDVTHGLFLPCHTSLYASLASIASSAVEKRIETLF